MCMTRFARAESSTPAGNLKTWILTKSLGKATCHSYVSKVLPVLVQKWLCVFCVVGGLLC